MRFVSPCQPTLRDAPPKGDGWIHEVKFDGWRLQLHKGSDRIALYTKNGHDYAGSLPELRQAVAGLRAETAVLDGELVACDATGAPDFHALHFHRADAIDLCVWAFDLIELNGQDLRELPLSQRKSLLHKLVLKTERHWLRYSENFEDGEKLLAAAAGMQLEGVVSKRAGAPYRSGRSSDWFKVKTAEWRSANRERWRMFDRRR